ncbi:hypothetical protein [Aurantimonas endophytica]|uniref:Uncharacterized protein n=1 Tax=Aurantimonas endophytica TaxID=1522175 RepID=A0A7W6MP96_9HYPH|nr:hypothetical protein [Aurantimonas endophytica]MBB4002642.1 hypothetical protein [Aurantimonas endophytica]MCO6403522.1 hypothetical protein [Aurantimonas endophytica]
MSSEKRLRATAEADAWCAFEASLPWLNRSRRTIVEIAAILQARLASGTLGVPGMHLYRVVLRQLGATPASASRVSMPTTPEEPDDLLD